MKKKLRRIKLTKKKLAVMLSVLLVAVCLGTVAMSFSSKAEAFDDTNPELEFISIQGNAETYKDVSAYDHESTFEQGDGKYTITTNSFVEWFPQDDVAFAYKYYGVRPSGNDTIEASVTVDYFTNPNGDAFDLSQGAHHPSTGLEFRAGLDNTSAFIYVHVRDAGQIVVVYRDSNYSTHLYGCTNQNGKTYTASDYPLQFKMVYKKGTVQVQYKSAAAEKWNKFTPVSMSDFSTGVYAGVCAHSGAPNQRMKATYTDLKMSGYASLSGSGGSTGGGDESVAPAEPADEDIPLKELENYENILLRETFTDNSLSNTPEKLENPVWSILSTRADVSVATMDGDRRLFAEYANTYDLVGEKDWTDYSVEMDVEFTEDCAEDASNIVGIIGRHVPNIFYGHQDYMVTIQGGHKICLYKNFNKKTVAISAGSIMETVDLRDIYEDESFTVLGDGIAHHLKAEFFDNTVTVYFDGIEVLAWEDTGTIKDSVGSAMLTNPNVGQVGVILNGVYAYVDDIIVRSMTDDLGGDYDNKIGGNWNEAIPDYIKENGES